MRIRYALYLAALGWILMLQGCGNKIITITNVDSKPKTEIETKVTIKEEIATPANPVSEDIISKEHQRYAANRPAIDIPSIIRKRELINDEYIMSRKMPGKKMSIKDSRYNIENLPGMFEEAHKNRIALMNSEAITNDPNGNIAKYIVGTWEVDRDCLWNIADRVYDDPFLWPVIYTANREQIENPDIIQPEQELLIP